MSAEQTVSPLGENFPTGGRAGDLALDDLVAVYLDGLGRIDPDPAESMDSAPRLGTAELAYGLDQTVSTYLEDQGLPLEQYHEIQQDLLNALADTLHDQGLADHDAIVYDDLGNADGAAVLGALDGHVQALLDMSQTQQPLLEQASSEVQEIQSFDC
ncbi:hypothetical protein [Synechococcus sp. CCY9202]|uniref:hypothetical protein n=1 Tax=Synechococcus sp. CCY9202 TaxID=174698 RepID=UPI002B1FE016|nr:hypothetical protein [Synechococcus sp. CCY9202]MEA5423793.1 hypothetical protein [Synechococcus sp. CCY9202]